MSFFSFGGGGGMPGGMPGGFPGGFPGGMPGGMGADDDDDEGASDNTKYYELLGIEKNATQQQIKKAFRKKAAQLHPDKHPDEVEKYTELFQEVTRAHEVLSDPDKRKLYDKYGEAGLKGGGQSSMGDLFDMFFGGGGPHGGGGGGRRRPQQRKAPPIRFPLDVTLEDLYLGTTKKVNYKRFILCKKCDGKGGSKLMTCPTCNGQGVQVVIQRMGYMTLQSQRKCGDCDGEGERIRDSDKCKICEGKGVKEEHKEMDLQIDVGTKHAEQKVMRGMGHEIPGTANGDLVVIFRCEKHKRFVRTGADLAMKWTLSLKEALCGYDFRIKHLSGQTLRIKSKRGEVVQPDELKVVHGKGMPQKGAPHVYGNLYIKFTVELPKTGTIDVSLLNKVGEILPVDEEKDIEMRKYEEAAAARHKREQEMIEKTRDRQRRKQAGEELSESEDEEMEEVERHETAEDVEGEPQVTPASSRSAYDEDEEEQGGVQCKHM